MKPLALLTALSVLFLSPALHADWVEDIVSQIRADYNATEGASLRQQVIQFDDGPVTAELKKYYRGDDLVKMAFTSGGDHGVATDYFYFKNGKLYFIYQEQGSWSFDPNGPEGTTIDTAREQRIYYHDDKVVRHLVKEASSRDAEAVPGLLKKAANQPVNDPEAAVGLGNSGYRLRAVKNSADLERYLYEE